MITAHIYGNSNKTEQFPSHYLCCKPEVGEQIGLYNDGSFDADKEKFPDGWYRVVSVIHRAKPSRSHDAPYLEIVVEPI